MATLILIAAIALTALCAGLLSGALLWHRHINRRTPPPPQCKHTLTAPGPLLWDVHSLLNIMSRFAVAAERGSPINPAVVYNLSDYLLHSSLLQRDSGWAVSHTLENWLQAHLAILAELRTQGTAPRVKVKFSERIRRIDVNPLIRQLHWLLQRTNTIASIEVHALSQEANPIATMTVAVFGAMDQIDRAPTEGPATGWHLDSGKCAFELHVDCELNVTSEARAA